MKTKGTKTSKSKSSEIRIRRIGAKVPKHKAKKKQIKKQGSFLKCLKMKSPRRLAVTESRPGSLLPSTLKLKDDCKPQSPFTPKRKKKKIAVQECNEEECIVTPKGPNTKSVEVPLNSCKNETELEHRNLGTPVIVEALSTSLTSLSIPESLQDQGNVIPKTLPNEIIPQVHEEVSKEENVCILLPSPAILCSKSQKDNQRRRRNSLNVASPRTPKNIPSPRTPQNVSTPRTSLNVPSPSTVQNVNQQSTSNDTPCQTIEAEDCCNNNTVNDPNANTSMDNANAEESVSNQENATRQRNSSSILIQEKNAPQLYCIRNKVVAIMKPKCRFCFTGKLILEVIYGSVQVYGCVVTPKSGPKEIYSPRGYSSVAIETYAQPEQSETDAWPSLFAQGINNETKNKLVDDINHLQPGAAVILLSYLGNKLTKFLQIYYPFRLFPKIHAPQTSSWTNLKRAEAILQSSLYFGSMKCKDLIFDSSLAEEVPEKILNSWRANEFSCTVIAGGKGVGKSTTMHYLINRLLDTSGKVILLDLDPGQAECTPSASISYSVIEETMLGPNFTHLKMPVFQVFLGDVNVSRCVTRYIEGVKMLVDKLTSCPVLSRLPIIVNTMGFVEGLGWDIMMFTLKLIRPSLVVQIVSDRSRNNFQDFLSSEVVNEQNFQWATWCSNVVDWHQACTHELHVMYSQAERRPIPGTESWNIEPYQKRELVTIAYLSQITNNTEDSSYSYRDSSISINQVVPYATPFSALSISIPDACVPPSHALTVINGNIVALCGIDIQTDSTATQEDSTSNDSSPTLLTRAPLCACYGYGIVRGVDMDKKEVYINTPVPASIMPHVNCLVGCMSIPVSLLQLNYFKNVPYTGGNDVVPTSREPRRGYFRMRFHNPQNPS